MLGLRAFNRLVPSRLGASASAACGSAVFQQARGFRHWPRASPDDFGLPIDSMPEDVDRLMKTKNPRELPAVDEYWYWRIRSETALLDPVNLPKKSYKELAREMGLTIVNAPNEHMMGLIELYEYLNSSPFVGPFGTIEHPVLVPAVGDDRVVGCTGGTGDNEHGPLWFRCRPGFMYRCGECDQIFMHVRVHYELNEVDANAVDPRDEVDAGDLFDTKQIGKVQEMWNGDHMQNWQVGYVAQDYLLGKGVLPGMKEFHTFVD